MIFYFTGTGNTRWAAQQLAEATGDELRFIPDELGKGELHYTLKDGERLGFCFPTHGWQPPRIVREFIRKATFTLQPSDITHQPSYIYALTTCGDNMGYAMRIFDKELSQKGLHTDARFAIVMPESNVCFSFLHLDTDEKALRKVNAARQRMTHICQVVKECQRDDHWRLLQQTHHHRPSLLGRCRGLHPVRSLCQAMSCRRHKRYTARVATQRTVYELSGLLSSLSPSRHPLGRHAARTVCFQR